MAGKRLNSNSNKKNTEVKDDNKPNTQSENVVSSKKETYKEAWTPDPTRMICVRNISKGGLIYKSKRQLGYTIIWDKRGDTNNIELGELLNLKNSDRRFITEPWIRIIEDDEIEILKYLNILKNYEDILGINSMTDILRLDFDKFKKKFDKFPKGYKNTLAEHAAEMITNGELDSIKIKKYIEKDLGIDLSLLIDSKGRTDKEQIEIL